MYFLEVSKKIGEVLEGIPNKWNAKEAIIEMKSVSYPHWKQMEWIGFYFQYLCEKFLSDFVKIPGPRYDNVSFDGFYKIPWDFKAHAMNTSSHRIIVNDSEAIANAIREHEAVGLILAIGKVEYNDEERTFQKWHEEIKGGKSEYEKERIKRGAWSRLRKVSFDLQQVSFLKITDATLMKCGSFQTDFRNSNGSPRRSKLLIDLENIDKEMEYYIEYHTREKRRKQI